MERDSSGTAHDCIIVHFNSHAHVERDNAGEIVNAGTEISTHTLTWSVTFVLIVSIFVISYFNSHAHVERDLTILCFAFS